MTVQDMIDQLALRLEDSARKKFTDSFKLQALSNAQIIAAQLLNDLYLTELQVLDANEAVSSGNVDFPDLTYRVLGGAEGIKGVKNYNGLHCAMLGLDDLKKEENTLLDATTRNPLAYIYENDIKVLPTGLTAIDVYYNKMPDILIFPFVMTALGVPGDTGFIGNDDQGLSATDDYYNNHVIYALDADKLSYHLVTDYSGSTRTFTVSPAASENFDDSETFYFATGDFDLTHLSGVTCDLNASLHDLVITLAEVECWKMAGSKDRSDNTFLVRAKSALESALNIVKRLNDRYEAPEGIGTEGRR